MHGPRISYRDNTSAMRQPGLSRDNERALAQRAKCDPTAFADLYSHYLPKIHRFVCARVGDQADVEDVTSEVFERALKSIHRYRDTGGHFRAWLYRIASCSVVDQYRASRPVEDIEQLHELAADGPGPYDIAAGRDELRRVRSVIDQLPDNQRIALVLRFQEDLPIEDIAAEMDKSSAAVKQLLHRGSHTIRRMVSRE
jgi:RNA polymerase sigma-70 factor, ECF subfamily